MELLIMGAVLALLARGNKDKVATGGGTTTLNTREQGCPRTVAREKNPNGPMGNVMTGPCRVDVVTNKWTESYDPSRRCIQPPC